MEQANRRLDPKIMLGLIVFIVAVVAIGPLKRKMPMYAVVRNDCAFTIFVQEFVFDSMSKRVDIGKPIEVLPGQKIDGRQLGWGKEAGHRLEIGSIVGYEALSIPDSKGATIGSEWKIEDGVFVLRFRRNR